MNYNKHPFIDDVYGRDCTISNNEGFLLNHNDNNNQVI